MMTMKMVHLLVSCPLLQNMSQGLILTLLITFYFEFPTEHAQCQGPRCISVPAPPR